jgi:parallel beta-helix repeat protein
MNFECFKPILSRVIWIFCAIISLNFHPLAIAQNIIKDEIWFGIIELTNDVRIPQGATLTVQPGTVIQFNSDRNPELLVEGKFIAEGMKENPITFTSTQAKANSWTWIRFSGTAEGRLKFCHVESANTGILLDGASPEISQTTFTKNSYGINAINSSALIHHNVFHDNGYGIVATNSNLTITHNVFHNNHIDAINLSGSNGVVKNNIIYNNDVNGIELEYNASDTVENNTIYGSGLHNIYLKNNSNSILLNNIISNAIGYGIAVWDNAMPQLSYNALWQNQGGHYYSFDTSNTFEPTPGDGMIIADPLFVNATRADFHLQPGSPCIDAGHPDSDYSNEPEPNGERINLGAYGNTSQAAVSSPSVTRYGDVNGDGAVNARDATLVLQHVVGLITFTPAQKEIGDVSGNGTISALDAAYILQYTVGLITAFPVESQK